MGTNYVLQHALEFGLRIVDARKPLRITVTAEDVRRSRQKASEDCAFACATRRQTKGAVAAYFFRGVAYVEEENRLVKYMLPGSMQKEIVSFDRTKVLEPGDYQLSAIPPSMRAEAIEERRSRKRPGTRKKKYQHRTGDVRSTKKCDR